MELSIIMRVCNRLEYTIQSIDNIINNTIGDYELIVFNNNSNDWTKERLTWMKNNIGSNRRDKVIIINSKKNFWDWGWMLEWIKYCKWKYICQFDNDLLIVNKWNKFWIWVLENTQYKIVMFKRQWERFELVESTEEYIELEWEKIQYGKIQKPVWCYIMLKSLFENCIKTIPANSSWQSKVLLSELVWWNVAKIINKPCKLMDAWDSPVYREYCDKRVETLRPLVSCLSWEKYPREKNWFYV